MKTLFNSARKKCIRLLGLAFLLSLLGTGQTLAQGTFQSNANGNWTVAGIWTLVGGTDADGIPDADDDVTIFDTVTASDGTGTPSTHEAKSLLIDGGQLRIGSGAVARTLNVITFFRIIGGGVSTTTSASTPIHTLRIGGNFTNDGTFTATNGNSTVNVFFNGTNQILGGTSTTTFRNLTINSGSSTITNRAVIIGGNLLVSDGASFEIPAFQITVNGTTTIGGGTSGSLLLTATPSTKRFDGLVTLNAGALWNNTANEAVNFRQ